MQIQVNRVLRIVTVWHPEDLFPCRTSELKSMPYLERKLAETKRRRELQRQRDGILSKPQPMSGGIVRIGSGNEVEHYRNKSICGEQLKPFVEGTLRPEPVLIYVPDEVKPKSKWKCELRTIPNWRILLQDEHPDGFDVLPDKVRINPAMSELLWNSLLSSTFRVCGFWVNPSRRDEIPHGEAINLVLGPIGGDQLQPADLRLYSEEERCWIEYAEDLNQ